MNKKKLSESDLCDKIIRPAIVQAGWHTLDQIYAQYPLRAGRVVVRGNLLLECPDFTTYAEKSATGTTIQNLGFKAIGDWPIALPPLAEQSRIVTRVASLRRLCDDLRQRLSASQSTQAHLAEALVENVA